MISTPIGPLNIICSDKGLIQICFLKNKTISKKQTKLVSPLVKQVELQLNEFFQKKRKSFNIPLDLKGTEFQVKAWRALMQIPFGETRSYAEQAKMMGKTRHYSRAVGNANNKNPIPIIIPCHRVVGSNGDLVGYAGGLKIKSTLIHLEKI